MPKTSVNTLLKDIELLSTIEMVRPFAVCFLIAIGKEREETKWGKGQRQVTEPPLPIGDPRLDRVTWASELRPFN